MKTKIEVWVDVLGYDGRYQVSNLGNVRSMNYKNTGLVRLMSPSIGGKCPYFNIGLYKDGKKKFHRVHRLMMSAFYGESELHVNHKDGDKLNNNLSNLEYVTMSENMIHAFDNNLHTIKGDLHPWSKLNEENVKSILTQLKSYKRGMVNDLAQKYKVDPSMITSIKKRKSWRHVTV